MLVEVPKDVAEEVAAGGTMVMRGREEDNTVMCTHNRYRHQTVKTSAPVTNRSCAQATSNVKAIQGNRAMFETCSCKAHCPFHCEQNLRRERGRDVQLYVTRSRVVPSSRHSGDRRDTHRRETVTVENCHRSLLQLPRNLAVQVKQKYDSLLSNPVLF